MRSKNPLKTDKTTISKAVPMVTPEILIVVRVEIREIFFLPKRYLLAINGVGFKIQYEIWNFNCI